MVRLKYEWKVDAQHLKDVLQCIQDVLGAESESNILLKIELVHYHGSLFSQTGKMMVAVVLLLFVLEMAQHLCKH